MAKRDDRPNERRWRQAEELRDLRAPGLVRPADSGTEPQRVRSNEDALGRTTLVVGVPFGVVAAQGDGDRNRGAGDVLGVRSELGQVGDLVSRFANR